MIVTEKDANSKVCQETFAYQNRLLYCIGSACMAWRWQTMGGATLHVDRTQGDDRSFGYCGKAGKP